MSSSPLLALALQGFAVWLSGYGFPHAIGYLVSFAQFIGSILMITGDSARLGALLNGIMMVGAMLFLTISYGFFGTRMALNLL